MSRCSASPISISSCLYHSYKLTFHGESSIPSTYRLGSPKPFQFCATKYGIDGNSTQSWLRSGYTSSSTDPIAKHGYQRSGSSLSASYSKCISPSWTSQALYGFAHFWTYGYTRFSTSRMFWWLAIPRITPTLNHLFGGSYNRSFSSTSCGPGRRSYAPIRGVVFPAHLTRYLPLTTPTRNLPPTFWKATCSRYCDPSCSDSSMLWNAALMLR